MLSPVFLIDYYSCENGNTSKRLLPLSYTYLFLSVHGSVLSLASNASSNYSTVRPLFTFCFSVWNLFDSNSKSCCCCHPSCVLDCGKANQSQMFSPCTMAHSNERCTKDKNHLLYWLSLSTDQYFEQGRTDNQVYNVFSANTE